MLKTLVKKAVGLIGYEVKKYSVSTSEVARLKHFLDYQNIDLVFDIGANVGQYAQFLREIGYGGKIVSFEPLSAAHSQLKKLSVKDSFWEVAPQTALGNENKDITINIAGNSQSSSVLPMLETHVQAASSSAYCGSEIVPLRRLDAIGKQYISSETKSVFLKIDVQGFEKEVIEGATQILPFVKGVQIELSLVPLYEGQPLFDEMLKMMRGLGYELYSVIPGFTDRKTGRLLQMDGIFAIM